AGNCEAANAASGGHRDEVRRWCFAARNVEAADAAGTGHRERCEARAADASRAVRGQRCEARSTDALATQTSRRQNIRNYEREVRSDFGATRARVSRDLAVSKWQSWA